MDTEFVSTFGQWLKVRRKALDLTQDKLAQQVGCSLAAIKKIESNERRPSRQIASLLAQHLLPSPDQHNIFIRVARGELPLQRLPQPRSEGSLQVSYPSSLSTPTLANPKNARHKVPIPPTPLIGREHEVANITALLKKAECRLLTLTGTGGIGKTRLAIEAAISLQDFFTQGVYFIPLAGIDSPDFMIPAIASALETTFSGPSDSKSQLFNYLREQNVLLVLDNMEHLLDGVDLFSELLQSTPSVKLLTTSREHLHLQAEWVFEVQGLPIPTSVQVSSLEANSAARLFLQRAHQAKTDFHMEAGDFPALARICQLVQGLPLAIELAANWTRTLSCQEIAQEIEHDLQFLAVNTHDIAHRHRSIQAVFDHSWELLSKREQTTLKRLSVFRGGFQREAAEQIAGANLALLSSLVGKSLVLRNDINHYNLHELLRQYFAVHLAEDTDEEQEIRGLHCRYYLTLLQSREKDLRSSFQKDALRELDLDLDNIRLAWNTALEKGYINLVCESAEPLYYFYELHQYFKEAEALFRHGVEQFQARFQSHETSNSTQEKDQLLSTIANLLNYQAFFNLRPGNNREALTLFESSLKILRTRDSVFPLAFALVHYGVVLWAMGDFEQAAKKMEEGLHLSQSLDSPWLLSTACGLLGGVYHDCGNYQAAYHLLCRSVEICREMEDPQLTAFMGIYYARTMMALNRSSEVKPQLQEWLNKVKATGNRWLTALVLNFLSKIYQIEGQAAEARPLLEESIQINREVGDRWSLAIALIDLSHLTRISFDYATSEQSSLEAFRLMAQAGYNPTALDALKALAECLAQQAKAADALILIDQILNHPSCRQETISQTEILKAQVAEQITEPVNQLSHYAQENFNSFMLDRFGISLPPSFYLANPEPVKAN